MADRDDLFYEVFPSERTPALNLDVRGCDAVRTECHREVRHPPAGVRTESGRLNGSSAGWDIQVDVPFADIYFHWLIDAIPQMHVAVESGLEIASIRTPQVTSTFQKQSAEYFGFLPYINVAHERDLDGDHSLALTSRCVTDSLYAPTWALDFLRQASRDIGSFRNRPEKRIWISRERARNRRVINEVDVMKALAPLGFEFVIAEDLDFADQVSLFSQAEFVAGPHGSGLANIAFMHPKASVLEVFGPRSSERCFARIARQLNLRYSALSLDCESHSHLSEPDRLHCARGEDAMSRWDFNAPVDQLIMSVQSVLNSV